MTEVVLFHHAQGLTGGCVAFAEDLRRAGHVVHTPDLYAGAIFESLEAGLAYAREMGFGTVLDRAREAAEALPETLVYLGFSLGAMPAQMLAQTRPGARGAVLLHAAAPLAEFGGQWPSGLPLQMHTMSEDEYSDAEVARELAAAISTAELYLYRGAVHVFTDRSLPGYDPDAAAMVGERVRRFVATLDR